MLSLLEHMYHELDIVRDLNINPITLRRWLVSYFALLHIGITAKLMVANFIVICTMEYLNFRIILYA